jgi:hypothetical protein
MDVKIVGAREALWQAQAPTEGREEISNEGSVM